MKRFFAYLLASILGIIIGLLLFFFIIMGIVGSMIPKEEIVTVKNNSILHFKLNYEVKERSAVNPLENFDFESFESNENPGLNDILKNIKKAADDDRIKGIYLDLGYFTCSFANLEEIRSQLKLFKESGKFIYAYGEVYSQKAYYLATVADKIYLNPEGMVEWKGLSVQSFFFKDALEKLGLEPQIIRHGKFKAAVEPFMLNKMSEENREQNMVLITTIWDEVLSKISSSRGISLAQLNKVADELSIRTGKDALKLNFVDELIYQDEFSKKLKHELEIPEKRKLKTISMGDYTPVPPQKREHKGLAKDKLAVIYAVGEIRSGEGDETTIGSATLSKAIREARKDSTVKAIVLRVNSPGGSALASDVILREIELAKEEKPVVVSMGGVAASGGYYIACKADKIYADPTTITGSIGVFGMLLNSSELMNDKLGIHIDQVNTNVYSDFGTVTRELKATERQSIQDAIEDIYATFVGHVMEGRSMTYEAVDEIGQGRVWSGKSALELGLVDELGGIAKAVEFAKEQAELEHFRIVEYPKIKDPIDKLIEELGGSVSTYFIKDRLGESYSVFQKIEQAISMEGIQAKMPYVLEIN